MDKQNNIISILTKKKYVFNKYLMGSAILLILILVLIIMQYYNFDKTPKIYVTCNTTLGYCENQIYQNPAICGKLLPYNHELCNTKKLPNGYTYGQPEPQIIKNFPYIAIGIITIAIIINHILFNNEGNKPKH